jgi:hypothetical protein
MSANDEGFFSRWSRRKALARAGQSLPPEEGRPPEPMAELAPGCPPSVSPAVDRAVVPVDDVAQVEQGREGSSQPPAPATSPPPPTLEDVRQLTLDADFRPFVDRRVPPEVRNAALRKLFSDPHFNVMDGLDVYIDDYSRPDPLPIETARRMVAAQFMGLFDERPAPESAKSAEDVSHAANPAQSAAADAVRAQPPSLSPSGDETADGADCPDVTECTRHPIDRPQASAT